MNADGDRFDPLLAQYLDGTLTGEEHEQLVALLESNPAKLAELRSQLLVSGALARLRPELSDETFLHAVLPHLGSVAGEDDEAFPQQIRNRIRFTRMRRTALAIAAILALIGTAAVFFWQGKPRAAGPVVAKLFDGADQAREVRVGEKLDFSKGVSRMEFTNGAVVAIEAPAALSIRSGEEVVLDHGRLNAWCPDTAHGFRVVTTSATLTDLGTSFGVSADPNGNTDFVVLDGKVEVERDGETRTVVKGNALRANRGKGLSDVAFEPSGFNRTWPVASGIRTTSGEVEPAPPGTPEVLAAMENDDHILVIPERRDFTLANPIRVDITSPGFYEAGSLFSQEEMTPEKGVKLRSYLLRYNPVGKIPRPEFRRFEGSVTFDRPVLGVIVASRKLNRSDNTLSKAPLPPLTPRDADLRGLERSQWPIPPDSVKLSDDRRTLTVIFYAGESIDEIRAITADD